MYWPAFLALQLLFFIFRPHFDILWEWRGGGAQFRDRRIPHAGFALHFGNRYHPAKQVQMQTSRSLTFQRHQTYWTWNSSSLLASVQNNNVIRLSPYLCPGAHGLGQFLRMLLSYVLQVMCWIPYGLASIKCFKLILKEISKLYHSFKTTCPGREKILGHFHPVLKDDQNVPLVDSGHPGYILHGSRKKAG